MCGIVGFTRGAAEAEDAQVLRRMTATLTHRGPDACGYVCNAQVALGHRRLAVIDLSGGAQPMALPEHGLHAVFNGEIYNYRELNAELAAKGFVARTRSDTETLLLAYAAWGDECVRRFNGMFAFVIHDARRGRLFGARDRLGKKPFYYVQRGECFAFASEPKALLQHPSVRRELDVATAARFLLFEYVPSPHAIYRDMHKLGAGETLTYDLTRRTLATHAYWDLADEIPRAGAAGGDEANEDAWGERLRAGLLAAVGRRLISDVPLGVFLSGGIDSSAVTAAMVRVQGRGQVKTFSIGFSDPRFDETAHARRVAEYLGTEHFEEHLDPRAALEILPTVCALLDEPFADPSILPCYLLSRFTRRHVTVALGGDGGDELFAGYDTFKALPVLALYNAAVPGVVDRGLVKRVARLLPASTGNFSPGFVAKQFLRGVKAREDERLWRWLGAYVPEELAELLTPDARASLDLGALYGGVRALHERVAGCDPVARDGYLYAKTYLEEVLVKVDRATMACSLEARSPLLDPEFVALCAALPSGLKVRRGQLKYIFKRALRGWLPAEILTRPKKGFGIPVAAWFRDGLREALLDTLHERRLREGGLFEPRAVARLIAEHLDGRHDRRKPLWTLFMFERWRETWLAAT